MEKGEGGGNKPAWAGEAISYLPRKWNELRTFLSEVRAELKKVTWPAKSEVYSTTIVVIATTIFFGFYLYCLDIVFSNAFTAVLKQ